MKYSRNVKKVKMVRIDVLLKLLTNFQEFRRFQFCRSVYRKYFRNNFWTVVVKSLSNSLGYHFQYRRFVFPNLQDSFHRVSHQVLLSWLSNMHLQAKIMVIHFHKVGCVFPMVVWRDFHREDALHFINFYYEIGNFFLGYCNFG